MKKEYKINNILHREDGPAVEYDDGAKFWYLNNQLHRENGPAVEPVRNCSWWLHGKNYSFEEFIKITPISDEEKIFLKFKYGENNDYFGSFSI